jgi:hypothetical protein
MARKAKNHATFCVAWFPALALYKVVGPDRFELSTYGLRVPGLNGPVGRMDARFWLSAVT